MSIMSLKSLVLSSDEKIVRVLRRVLNDLEISVEHSTGADHAIRTLTRQRFEAVIVDCVNMESAASVLKSVRNSPSNKRAVSVAIVEAQTGLKGAFEMGAHFVLYKPLSPERAKSSFRAARALMKRERRRNFRLPIQIPITFNNGLRALTVELLVPSKNRNTEHNVVCDRAGAAVLLLQAMHRLSAAYATQAAEARGKGQGTSEAFAWRMKGGEW